MVWHEAVGYNIDTKLTFIFFALFQKPSVVSFFKKDSFFAVAATEYMVEVVLDKWEFSKGH